MLTISRFLFLGLFTLTHVVMAGETEYIYPTKFVDKIEQTLLAKRDPLDTFKISVAFKNLEGEELGYGASRIDYGSNPRFLATIILSVVDDKSYKAEVSLNMENEKEILTSLTYGLAGRTLIVGPVSKKTTAVFENENDAELANILVEFMGNFSRRFE